MLTDLTGQTGLKIVRSILAGERNPEILAGHRDPRCHAAHPEIVAALTGNYRAEHLFALKQNFAACEFLLQQLAECDNPKSKPCSLPRRRSNRHLLPHVACCKRRKRVSKHASAFDLRSPLHRLTGGADLSQIDSIGPQAALQIIAEIPGPELCVLGLPQSDHFTSWLALAPNNKVSGGRLLSSRTPPSANRAATILRRCAMSLGKTF